MSTATPEQVLESIVTGINAGDLDGLMPLYESEAAFATDTLDDLRARCVVVPTHAAGASLRRKRPVTERPTSARPAGGPL